MQLTVVPTTSYIVALSRNLKLRMVFNKFLALIVVFKLQMGRYCGEGNWGTFSTPLHRVISCNTLVPVGQVQQNNPSGVRTWKLYWAASQ